MIIESIIYSTTSQSSCICKCYEEKLSITFPICCLQQLIKLYAMLFPSLPTYIPHFLLFLILWNMENIGSPLDNICRCLCNSYIYTYSIKISFMVVHEYNLSSLLSYDDLRVCACMCARVHACVWMCMCACVL